MGVLPNKSKFDFKGIDLYKIIRRENFALLIDFLNSNGGLNASDEYQRTVLMELILERNKDYSKSENTPYSNFENEFAIKLIELGADVNIKDKCGYTALKFAVQQRNAQMVEYLLGCANIDGINKTLHINYHGGNDDHDRIMAAFTKAGYDLFGDRYNILGHKIVQSAPIFSFDKIMEYHTANDIKPLDFFTINSINWYEYKKTLAVISEMYPEKLPTIPAHYLSTIQYDFLATDFLNQYPNIYGSKKRLKDFIKPLSNGIASVDEYGRNLMSICYESLIWCTLDPTKQSKSDAKYYTIEQKNFTKTIAYLIEMKCSDSVVDRFGKTAQDYKNTLEEKRKKLAI